MKIITNRELFEKTKICHPNPEYFFREFLKQRRCTRSNVIAYLETEKVHELVAGICRYEDYESFRAFLRRRKKKKFINIDNS